MVPGLPPLVHALLRHLEEAGFAGAPRFLGIDAAGREVLTFVPGEVAGRPRPEWIADEERLASVGRLVRAYDDAKPVARVDEMCNTMVYWAPLMDPVDADPPLRDVDAPRRCRILADAYGMSEADRARLVEVAVLRSRRSWFTPRDHSGRPA
ncbi:hypothetical protein ABGB14_40175 [Nonomuraea sp. B10E15]|uniref:hypothetical protein n=1 Tax=Nonomuraea sp. B10E15 TaxID=3153560 RepID=UPI00325F8A60